MISQAELKKRLRYNKRTGLFTHLIGHRRGVIAGCIHPDKYRYIRIGQYNYKAARLAWLYVTGEQPTKQIQHKNGIYDDDRWVNLRHASQWVNTICCVPRRRLGLSGYRGVTQLVGGRYWAKIRVRGKNISLRTYKTAKEAAHAYKKAESKYFGGTRGQA